MIDVKKASEPISLTPEDKLALALAEVRAESDGIARAIPEITWVRDDRIEGITDQSFDIPYVRWSGPAVEALSMKQVKLMVRHAVTHILMDPRV